MSTESPTTLPTYEECEAAVDNGTATKLQAFIYNQEPANQTDLFREGLRAVIAESRRTASVGADAAAFNRGLEAAAKIADSLATCNCPVIENHGRQGHNLTIHRIGCDEGGFAETIAAEIRARITSLVSALPSDAAEIVAEMAREQTK